MANERDSDAKTIDVKTFWQAVGQRATGATIVTAHGSGGPAGLVLDIDKGPKELRNLIDATERRRANRQLEKAAMQLPTELQGVVTVLRTLPASQTTRRDPRRNARDAPRRGEATLCGTASMARCDPYWNPDQGRNSQRDDS